MGSHNQLPVIALAGNPNVGKSTLFNALTGLKQHTGNWPGKTVASAQGVCRLGSRPFLLADIPGTYSLMAHSQEEEVARNFLLFEQPDGVIIVCDATCLERNLNLVLQTLEITRRAIVCVNLMDEAKRRQIHVDLPALEKQLGVKVVGVCARKPHTLQKLLEAVDGLLTAPNQPSPVAPSGEAIETAIGDAAALVREAERIFHACVSAPGSGYSRRDRRLDRLLTSPLTGYPLMLVALLFVFWLTVAGANIPSQFLSNILFGFQDQLTHWFTAMNAPEWLHGALVLGMYRVLAWVVSVMLPPMAIFFPLFTLLEDAGFLPRIAFNLDRPFQKCRACGKQALCMAMGLGCNAVGVVGCRIIDSPRERLIAILTNSLVPCNGRFPTLIALISLFVAVEASSLVSAAALTGLILLSILMTFAASKWLSMTVLKGMPSSFTLELPPYRRPQVGKVLLRSLLDRTLFVLGRAVTAAAPAGLLIWLMANITWGSQTLLARCTAFFDPLGRLMGLDGVILTAFILGLPANEIVVPIMLMAYLSQGTLVEADLFAMKDLLLQKGWTFMTAFSMLIFTLFHWPCATTLMTIRKETGSLKWTALAALLPTLIGMGLCVFLNLLIP